MIKKLLLANLLFGIVFSFGSCTDEDDPINKTPSELLSAYVWETTQVTDQNGTKLDLSTMPANSYVGYAYYKQDSTFRIVSLNDEPKIFGKWSLIENDKKRHLEVFKTDNSLAYTRDVDILELTNSKFTYRIFPSAEEPNKYYDVVHVPVKNHPEPAIPAELLASISWKTTNVYDITSFYTGAVGSTSENNPVDPSKINEQAIASANLQALDNTQQPASNYAGDAYYTNSNGNLYFPKNESGRYVNGTFKITVFDDVNNIRSQGDWYVSLDGKQRVLYAKNADGNIIWSRIVSIHELTKTKFTYDIVHNSQVLRVEHISK